MPLFAGDLDRRIVFSVRVNGEKNGFGDPAIDLRPLPAVWAGVTFVKDGERFRAAQGEATVTHRFQVRWSRRVAEIDDTALITFDGRVYEIVGSPKELGRREGIEFSATAKVKRGQR